MKPHATKIFQHIVNALGAYVQSLFVAANVNTPPGMWILRPWVSGTHWKTGSVVSHDIILHEALVGY